MTLAEKAETPFQTMIVVGSGDLAEPSSAFGVDSAKHMINNQPAQPFQRRTGCRRRQGTC
jgi:hypothetical protein